MMCIRSFIFLSSVVYLVYCSSVPEELKNLAAKWAPLVYQPRNEQFLPSSVPFFFENTKLESEPLMPLTISTIPKCSPDCFLVTKKSLFLASSKLSFFKGQSLDVAPVYSVIKQTGSTTVIYYWFFYPYNLGKKVCLGYVAKLFGKNICFGIRKRFGSHVGDWEHIEIKFIDNKPVSIYLAYHSSGHKFLYDADQDEFVNSNGQPKLQFFPGSKHAIIFAAKGSHGSWSSEGVHPYLKLPNNQQLTDECSKGEPWHTWKNLVIGMYDPTRSYDSSPVGFFRFQGRWGNRRRACADFVDDDACVLSSAPFTPSMQVDEKR